MSMDLTSILKRDAAVEDHSLVDHSWMRDTGLARIDDPILDIESMRNPNNVKPQLELEWSLGGPDVDLDEPAGMVKRNIPEENLGDADAVILFARDLMNRGLRGRQVAAALRGKYPPVLIAKAQKGLRAMFALEGLVGRIMVDARGYKSCQAAMKAASNSPYKRFIKYVYGCNCGDPHNLPMNDMGLFDNVQASSGNGFDDFLAGEKSTAKIVSHCRSTMMPILGAGDLDKSMLDSTFIEMMNLTPVPQSVVNQVTAMSISNLGKARAAFRWLDKKIDAAEDARYAGGVDSSEFKILMADNEIDLMGTPQSELFVDGTNPSLSTDIETEGFAPTNFDGPQALPGILDDVELMGPVDQDQIPVEMMDGENLSELELRDDVHAPGQLDLDERSGEIEVELFDSPQLDVEMSQFKEPEFEGTDVIDLEQPGCVLDDLDVDMTQNQDIEL
jgi:hypothetical protein